MNIFITGSTGFLGGEILVNLSKRKEVNKIYCLVRAQSEVDAILRLDKVFGFHGDFYDRDKVIPVIGNLVDSDLTAQLIANKEISNVNVIIHSAANTSFSGIYDRMVEQTNIEGLEKVVLWAKQLKNFNTFLHIGTATICGKEVKNRLVREEESPNPNASHVVSYTHSKAQGELIIRKHLPANKILIARPSIIMGDSRDITPRSPVILWACATINQIRLIPANPQAKLDVISVDYAAEAIVKLLFTKRKHDVYHISSGPEAATSAHHLSVVFEEYFNELPRYCFVKNDMLKQMKLLAKNKLPLGSELSKYPEYIKHWKDTFGELSNLRILFAGLDPYLEFLNLGQVFDNSKLLADVDIAKPTPAHEYIVRQMSYLEKLDVFEGAMDF
ncbi:MAG TPA: SDR family oxidoreductase [Bacteroidia bacterium]|jgi:thioester reductase-like protein|nr:SDR family oxidoreductase [Bacteroidia bacterium]